MENEIKKKKNFSKSLFYLMFLLVIFVVDNSGVPEYYMPFFASFLIVIGFYGFYRGIKERNILENKMFYCIALIAVLIGSSIILSSQEIHKIGLFGLIILLLIEALNASVNLVLEKKEVSIKRETNTVQQVIN